MTARSFKFNTIIEGGSQEEKGGGGEFWFMSSHKFLNALIALKKYYYRIYQ